MAIYLASDDAAEVTGQVFETIAGSIGAYNRPEVRVRVMKDPRLGPWTQAELRSALPATLFPAATPSPHSDAHEADTRKEAQ